MPSQTITSQSCPKGTRLINGQCVYAVVSPGMYHYGRWNGNAVPSFPGISQVVLRLSGLQPLHAELPIKAPPPPPPPRGVQSVTIPYSSIAARTTTISRVTTTSSRTTSQTLPPRVRVFFRNG